MKARLLSTLLLFSGILSSAQEIARLEKVEIKSGILHQTRPLLIYTPQLYDENILVNYDVIYVFDSQNREMFDLVHSLIKFIDLSKRYIVVGVTSPYYEETDYARNHDYLPHPIHTDKKDFFGGYCCNSTNFKKFVMSEVVPYIDQHYRTTKNKISIGHSLSASFILDFMLTNDFFDAYLAFSPNFAYDKMQLANAVTGFNFKKIKSNRYLYITHANENWKGWTEARERVYAFLKDPQNIPGHIQIDTAGYPDEDHWFGYLPALKDGLKNYFKYTETQPHVLSEERYKVKIKVRVPDRDNKVFITGNQESLGNWVPSFLEMKRVSDYEREIELEMQSPAQILFSRGDWETKAIVNYVYVNDNISIEPSSKNYFEFEITGWFDDED